MYNTNHIFKVYNSVVSSIFTELCNCCQRGGLPWLGVQVLEQRIERDTEVKW